MIRISITGPESSGKTELTKSLALHFNTSFACEYAREYLEINGPSYTVDELDIICEGQIRNEENALSKAERLVFFDTDMLVLKIWSEFRFGKSSDYIASQYESRSYDLSLLCYPDLEWEDDPLRESRGKEERDHLFELYKDSLEEKNAPYVIIRGHGELRLELAIEAIENFLQSLN